MNIFIYGFIITIGLRLAFSLHQLKFYGQEGAVGIIVTLAIIGIINQVIKDYY